MKKMIQGLAAFALIAFATAMSPAPASAATFDDSVPQAQCAPKDFHRDKNQNYDGCLVGGSSGSSAAQGSPYAAECEQLVRDGYESPMTSAAATGVITGVTGHYQGRSILDAIRAPRNYEKGYDKSAIIGAAGSAILAGRQQAANRNTARVNCNAYGPPSVYRNRLGGSPPR